MKNIFPNVIVILVCMGAVAVGAGVGILATPDGTPITNQRTIVGNSPISVSNGNGSAGDPTISIQAADVSHDGYLKSNDWQRIAAFTNTVTFATPTSNLTNYVFTTPGIYKINLTNAFRLVSVTKPPSGLTATYVIYGTNYSGANQTFDVTNTYDALGPNTLTTVTNNKSFMLTIQADADLVQYGFTVKP